MELKSYYAQDKNGETIPGAYVYLYEKNSTTLVTGIEDAEGNAMPNPFQADEDGLFQVAAPDGVYDLRVTSTGRDNTLRVQFLDLSAAVASAESSVENANVAADRAELARDAAVSVDSAYSTYSEGLAAVADGQFFSVLNAGGTKRYIYQRLSGAGVLKGITPGPAASLATYIGQDVSKQSGFLVTPAIDYDSVDAGFGYNAVQRYGRKPYLNLLPFGGRGKLLNAYSMTNQVTVSGYKPGVSGNDAIQLEFAAGSGSVPYVRIRFDVPPGQYTLCFEVKSDDAANITTAFPYLGTKVDHSVGSSFSTIEQTVEFTSESYNYIEIAPASALPTSAATFIVDALRIVPGATASDAEDPEAGVYGDVRNVDFSAAPLISGEGVAKAASGESFSNGISGFFAIKGPVSPASIEYIFDDTSGAGRGFNYKLLSPSGTLTTPISEPFAAPWAWNSGQSGGLEKINNRWIIVGYCSGTDGTDFYLNGIKSGQGALSAPAFLDNYVSLFRFNLSAYHFNGEVSGLSIFNAKLNDIEAKNVFEQLKGRLLAKGYQLQSIKNMVIVEGDSNSHGQTLGRFCWTHQVASLFPGNTQGSMFARSGDTLADLESRQSMIEGVIAEHLSAGRNPIVSVLIGQNDTIDSSAQASDYYARLTAYTNALMATGAKVIQCTLLPVNGVDNTYRDQVSASLRADSSSYTSLCDFADDANLGTWNSSYYSDWKHPSQDGFNLMTEIAIGVFENLYL